MMASVLPGLVITVQPGGGEHPLPRPLPSRVRVLPAEAAWQLDPAGAAGDIALVETSHALEVAPQRLPDDPGEDRDPVLVALAGPHDDVARLEVDVLHAKPSALEQPQAGAVEKARHELRRPRELCDHRAHLVAREDDREATRTPRARMLAREESPLGRSTGFDMRRVRHADGL